jgi:cell division transport system ATP-binding protein
MLISFDHVTKKYGSVTALSDITFGIKKGDFTFLTGPSGSGKTTIIKLLQRETVPSSGNVLIEDSNISLVKSSQIPFLRRRIGVVFQDFKLIPDRTVYENIALGLDIRGSLNSDNYSRIDEVLNLTGLADRANLFPAQLAGGEMQRVCLGRAIVGHPEILLADEPTGNLDVTTSWQIIKLIRKIHKMGTTVLMVTHNVDIVNSFSDRVLLLRGGKLIKDQTHGKYEF